MATPDPSTRYFHASPTTFAPGDVLLPPSRTGVTPNYTVGRPTTRVFFSITLEEAQEWSAHLAGETGQPVHIYEVQPQGRLYSKWLEDMEVVEFHAPSATVLALIETFTFSPVTPMAVTN